MQPLYADLAAGRVDFTPTKEEFSRLVRSFYSARRNLLVRFSADPIDETADLAGLLQASAAASAPPGLDLAVRVLPGDHVRPLQQLLPPDVAAAAGAGGALLGRLAAMAGPAGMPGTPLGELARGVSGLAAGAAQGRSAAAEADVEALVDELAAFMGLRRSSREGPNGGRRELPGGVSYLPPGAP